MPESLISKGSLVKEFVTRIVASSKVFVRGMYFKLILNSDFVRRRIDIIPVDVDVKQVEPTISMLVIEIVKSLLLCRMHCSSLNSPR